MREAAARRFAARSQNLPQGSTDLVGELLARDEELAAAAEELREQVEDLKRVAALLERERSKYLDIFALAPEA
ncbi:MAG: hypothetical protein JOZ69_23730 [Myxococcales bacterium]|nr:hypothetical protein [Myxococcales bacterium]